MFDILLSVTFLIKSTFYYTFYASFNTGKFIVNLSTNILRYSVILLRNLLSFCVILLESITIFLQDIIGGIQEAVALTSKFFDGITNTVANVFQSLDKTYDSCYMASSTLGECIEKAFLGVFLSIGQLVSFIKYLIILFGSGTWFAITIIPVSLINLLDLVLTCLNRITFELFDRSLRSVIWIKNFIYAAYEFVTDVPYESIAGLFVALCIIYVFVQFYLVLMNYIYVTLNSIVRGVKQTTRNIFIGLQQKIINYLNRNQINVQRPNLARPQIHRPQVFRVPRSRERTKQKQELNELSGNDERACVICQERIKCILLLPCRHVCMCTECSYRLELYNNNCPICRNAIESTMKIFV